MATSLGTPVDLLDRSDHRPDGQQLTESLIPNGPGVRTLGQHGVSTSTEDVVGTSRVRARRPRRTLKDRVVRGLAQVGLLWSLALLWFVFSAMAAQGTQTAQLSGSGTRTSLVFTDPLAGSGGTPSTLGLVLALTVLTGGVTALVWGSLRGAAPPRAALPEPPTEAPAGLELALGLGLAPYRAPA
jgi:hypothetical protein